MMESEADIMNDSSSSSPDVLPLYNQEDNRTSCRTFRTSSKVISNRIFVGGFDYLVKDSDLHDLFSQHGTVKDANVVTSRSGMSKGYGFVTFENQEDANKLLQDDNDIIFRDKKLTIGQAFRKQQSRNRCGPGFAVPLPVFCCAMGQNSCAGSPYIYHSGCPHIYCPSMNCCPHQWPSCCHTHHHQTSLSPLLPQPPYQTPACQLYQMPFDPVAYAEPSEYFYLPTEGGPDHPVHVVMENTTEEVVEPSVATGPTTLLSEN